MPENYSSPTGDTDFKARVPELGSLMGSDEASDTPVEASRAGIEPLKPLTEEEQKAANQQKYYNMLEDSYKALDSGNDAEAEVLFQLAYTFRDDNGLHQ
jgi:hypothetical protein